MSNSADNAPAQTKKVTMVNYTARPGSKDKKYDSPTPSFNRDNTSSNNQSPVREDGPEPEPEAATLPENNDSEAGSLSSSTTSTAVDVLKTATTTSVTKVTENNSEGGSKEEGSSTTILEIKTTTSLLLTTLENNNPKDGSQGQCSSTTEIKAVTATRSNSSSSSTTTTDTADHDVKINDTTPATTSAATQTIVLIVTPIDTNPPLEKAVSDNSRINQAQLPTANDDGNPTESRVFHESNSEMKISTSRETHTDSQGPNLHLQSPNHQKMTTNSRPEGADDIPQQGEKLNNCCCCIYW